MAQKIPKVSYDNEAKILSIRLAKDKGVDSDVYGNVVVDYGKNGKPVNIDIMEISLNEFRRVPAARKLIATFSAA